MTTETKFTDFGNHFQDKLVQAVLIDAKFAEQILEILDVNFFDLKFHQDLISLTSSYFNKYKALPSIKILDTLITTELSDPISKDQCKLFVFSLTDCLNKGKLDDIEFVKEKSLDFCKKQNLKNALKNAFDMLQHSKYEEIVDLIKKSVLLGSDKDIGIDYMDQLDLRLSENFISGRKFRTPWDQLNGKIMDGGWSAKELYVFMAPVTRGKSHMLAQSGAEGIISGFNVAHYTLELADIKTAKRYDSYISQIPYNDLIENREAVKQKVREKVKGRLFVKEYPTKTASCLTIRNHIQKLISKGIKPDMIIVDYADLIRPTNRGEKRFELEEIYQDLRGMAGEFDAAVITATQSTRDSGDSEAITLEEIAESYLKASVADTVISLSRRPEDMMLGTGRVFIAKNRSGLSGGIFNVTIDTATSTIKFLEDEPVPFNYTKKSVLKNSWKKVKEDQNEYTK